MFFFWPTLNERTLSGQRTPAALDRLEERMTEFLVAKRSHGDRELIDRIERDREGIRTESLKVRLRHQLMVEVNPGAKQQPAEIAAEQPTEDLPDDIRRAA